MTCHVLYGDPDIRYVYAACRKLPPRRYSRCKRQDGFSKTRWLKLQSKDITQFTMWVQYKKEKK
jgi:hypothetical protein